MVHIKLKHTYGLLLLESMLYGSRAAGLAPAPHAFYAYHQRDHLLGEIAE